MIKLDESEVLGQKCAIANVEMSIFISALHFSHF